MAIKNTTWTRIEPGQIVTFSYRSKDDTRPVKRTVLCINPELSFRKKSTGRVVKYFIGVQLFRQGERSIASNDLKRIIFRMGGLESEDGIFGANIDEDISKVDTQKIVRQLKNYKHLYRTYYLRECRKKRVFLEVSYKQIPKNEIKELESLVNINED